MTQIITMLDRFGTLPRLGAALLCGALAFLSSWVILNREEAFFWAVVVLFATAMFLLVKREMPLLEKLRRVGLWDLMAPVVLIVLATYNDPRGMMSEAALLDNSLRLVFAVMFFVGVGTALRVVFRFGKR